MTVETRSPSQAEWAAALPMEANVAGVLGDLGTSANRKIWMNFYHVYAMLQLSEVDVRTGNRGTSCLGLIVCCCTLVLWEFLVVCVGVLAVTVCLACVLSLTRVQDPWRPQRRSRGVALLRQGARHHVVRRQPRLHDVLAAVQCQVGPVARRQLPRHGGPGALGVGVGRQERPGQEGPPPRALHTVEAGGPALIALQAHWQLGGMHVIHCFLNALGSPCTGRGRNVHLVWSTNTPQNVIEASYQAKPQWSTLVCRRATQGR